MSKYINVENELIKIRKSFPVLIEPELDSLLLKIKVYSEYNANWWCNIILEQEVLEIPSRIYWDEYRLLEPKDLSKIEEEILACIMTRHYNGFIREKYLNQILLSNEYWVMPYIVQLMGEYVVELLDAICMNFEKINFKNLSKFINENEIFWIKTKQRVYSYWDCYHKYKCEPKLDYVGFQLINKIEKSIKNN